MKAQVLEDATDLDITETELRKDVSRHCRERLLSVLVSVISALTRHTPCF
jgi:hypothetical protein